MAKATVRSATQRAVEIFYGRVGPTDMGSFRTRMAEIRSNPSKHSIEVDRTVAMALLGLSPATMKRCIKTDPPPHPFKVPTAPAKLPRGRPKTPKVRRKGGAQAAVATVGEVVRWFGEVIKAGVVDADRPTGALPDRAKVPSQFDLMNFYVEHDPKTMKTIVHGALLSPLEILDALERRPGGIFAFMPLEEALRDHEWSDPPLRLRWAKAYAQALREDADGLLMLVTAKVELQVLEQVVPKIRN